MNKSDVLIGLAVLGLLVSIAKKTSAASPTPTPTQQAISTPSGQGAISNIANVYGQKFANNLVTAALNTTNATDTVAMLNKLQGQIGQDSLQKNPDGSSYIPGDPAPGTGPASYYDVNYLLKVAPLPPVPTTQSVVSASIYDSTKRQLAAAQEKATTSHDPSRREYFAVTAERLSRMLAGMIRGK